MKHEIKKISKILDELVTYCFLKHSSKLDIQVERGEDFFSITLRTDDFECTKDQLQKLQEYMQVQRQREIESYYWQLAGESENACELSLVGMMVDEAKVEFEEGRLTIYLKRNQ